MKKPQFTTLRRSKTFRNRDQAEDWAKMSAEDIERQGFSTKKEINFDDKTSRWTAKIFIKSTGKNSLES